MPVVVVPDPSLVALVGAAGSGKSTLAARLFAPDEILSSDAFRAAIAGDPSDQRATRPAFAALHRALDRRLRAGQLAVVDATNAEPHARRSLLRHARVADVPAIALVLDMPPHVVQSRNAGRAGRSVARDVVARHLGLVRASLELGWIAAEGWDALLVVRDPADLDALRVARRRGAADRTAAG